MKTTPGHADLYTSLAARFTTVVDDVPHDRWDAPSPCEGWSTADVLTHVIETQRSLFADRGFTVSESTSSGYAQCWAEHRDAVTALLTDDVLSTAYEGFFGSTTLGDTLSMFYAFDLIVHRWDIATAAGLSTKMDDDEVALCDNAMHLMGEALYMDGICRRPISVPTDVTAQDRVLAALGRRAL